MKQQPEESIGQGNNYHCAQVDKTSLAPIDNEVNKMRKPYTRAPKDVARIDVGSLNTVEIDQKMRELYERTDEDWRCLMCNYTSKASLSSNIRKHVEIHMDGLVYTCNLCSKEFRSRQTLIDHKRSKYHQTI